VGGVSNEPLGLDTSRRQEFKSDLIPAALKIAQDGLETQVAAQYGGLNGA
jgi:hypothetical protein